MSHTVRAKKVNPILLMNKLYEYVYHLKLVTHAGCIAADMGIAFSRICLSLCLSVCPCSKRKTARAIDTKLCTRILYSSCSAPRGQKVKVTRLRKVTVTQLLVTRAATAV